MGGKLCGWSQTFVARVITSIGTSTSLLDKDITELIGVGHAEAEIPSYIDWTLVEAACWTAWGRGLSDGDLAGKYFAALTTEKMAEHAQNMPRGTIGLERPSACSRR